MRNRRIRRSAALIIVFVLPVMIMQTSRRRPPPRIVGNWDAYVALGSVSRGGFEGWRRMGFGEFTHTSAGYAGSIRRRTGEPMLAVTNVETRGDSVTVSGENEQSLKAAWHGDTLSGQLLTRGRPSGRRMRLVRRSTPFVVEKNYDLWPSAVSDSQYAVTEDTAVFMKTRDGARLVSYIARPVGNGPFG